jgi:glucokinase
MKSTTTSQIILAGDIGGTHSRFGLFRTGGDRCRPLFEKSFPNQNYTGVERILAEFLKGQRVALACIGVAGPVTKKSVKITNLPWIIDGRSLQEMLSCRVEVINDLVANAYGISVLQKRDFMVLNNGRIRKGNRALISAGTGLGEAILFWDGKEHIPSPSEGGHAEFAPSTRLEMGLLDYLFTLYDHVSYERVLSGPGLHAIYKFLRDRKKSGREPKWLSEKMEHEDPSHVISEIARQKRKTLCGMALDLFVSIYGAAAGNLALQVMAVGGLFLGGGIAPGIAWKLNEGSFMGAFKKKGRLSNVVANIPVKVIMNDKAALLGAARCGMQTLSSL